MEEYLFHVVDQDFSFVVKKQNKLTYEVCVTIGMQEKYDWNGFASCGKSEMEPWWETEFTDRTITKGYSNLR